MWCYHSNETSMTKLQHLGLSKIIFNFEALLFLFLFFDGLKYFTRSVSDQVRTFRQSPPVLRLQTFFLGTLENYDEDNLVPSRTWERGCGEEGNGNIKKSIVLVQQNNNSAHASRFFVHFFAVPEQLRRLSLLENGNGLAINYQSLSELWRGPL